MGTFSDRMKIYMDQNGMSQTDVIEKCQPFCKKLNVKISKGTMSLYLSGKRNPKLDKIKLIGLALNVSTEWLTGDSDDPIPKKEDHTSGIESLYFMLNDAGKQKVIDYIADLLENPRYKKEEK